MNKLIFILATVVSMSLGISYYRFGAVNPCKILEKKVEQIFEKKIMSKISNETGSALAKIVANKLTHKIIKTLSTPQCIEVFFNTQKIKKILYEVNSGSNDRTTIN